ncbi:MAG: 50S ribosomal protein L11 methyltransferase [bacterium]|nr:50S ribosomal protein L11 methyltransferase [bacterium]
MILIFDLFLITLLLVLLSIIWPPGAPWVPAPKDKILKMLKMLKLKPDEIVYDLGSGDGRILIVAAQEFGAKGVGVEIDPLRVFYSQALIRIKGFSPKIKIIRQNILEADLSGADAVTLFLLPKILSKLKEKLLKELKPGARIACYRYPLDLPELNRDEKEKIFIYQIK